MLSGFSRSANYLFEEARHLLIISTSSQDFWLGILIRAPEHLARYGLLADSSVSDGTGGVELLKRVSADLMAEWNLLADSCAEVGAYLPSLGIWITEALRACEDIQKVRQSKVRNFLRGLSESADGSIQGELRLTAHSVVELICLLPPQMLDGLLRFVQIHSRLPQPDELGVWLQDQAECGDPVAKIQQRAKAARDVLAIGYLRYALRMARNYVDQGVDYADLAQEGFIGLMKAAERFDYRTHVRFATYATSWIWQSIGRAIADQSRTIRVPVHIHEQIRKLEGIYRQSTQVGGQADMVSDGLTGTLVADLNDPAELNDDAAESSDNQEGADDKRVNEQDRIQRMLEWAHPILSLDMRVPCSITDDAEDDDNQRETPTLADLIGCSDDIELESVVDEPMISLAMQRVMDVLTPRQREVLGLRFGLFDGQPHTLEEIGEQFGLTRERIRQIEAKSFERLQHPARVDAFKKMLVDASLGVHHKELPRLPSSICQHIDECFSPWSRSRDQAEQNRYAWLDLELATLPGGDWHQSRLDEGVAYCDEIQAALRLLGVPAHYSEIADQLSADSDPGSHTPNSVYSFLFQHTEAFLYLGEGVFSLVEWEQERTRQSAPVLPFCPTIPSDSGFQSDRFFEVAMLLCSSLSEHSILEDIVRNILNWSSVEVIPPKWVVQSILSSYYLIGLIPYLLYESDNMMDCHLCFPKGDVHAVRRHALVAFSERLSGMPAFWWLFQQYQPMKLSDLGRQFTAVNGTGLDDVANRLRVLVSIGAARRHPDGRFSLTLLGEEFASRLKLKSTPCLSIGQSSNQSMSTDDALDWADLLVW